MSVAGSIYDGARVLLGRPSLMDGSGSSLTIEYPKNGVGVVYVCDRVTYVYSIRARQRTGVETLEAARR
jgi:hypothetical protein